VICELEGMIKKTLELRQRKLFNMGLARRLAKSYVRTMGNFFAASSGWLCWLRAIKLNS